MAAIIVSRFLKLQAPNNLAAKKIEYRPCSRAMTTRQPQGYYAPTAIRMRALRRFSPYPARQAFADYLGITLSTLSNIENGFPISRAVESKVVGKMPWISGDWLQRGNEASLTVATVQRLLPLLAEESDTTAPRTRAPRSSRSGN